MQIVRTVLCISKEFLAESCHCSGLDNALALVLMAEITDDKVAVIDSIDDLHITGLALLVKSR